MVYIRDVEKRSTFVYTSFLSECSNKWLLLVNLVEQVFSCGRIPNKINEINNKNYNNNGLFLIIKRGLIGHYYFALP